ncbi:MAG: ABC transporter permease [Parashewanella sp.]
MSSYLRALRHGLLRLFYFPRLSIPVLLTLSLTLAAVLTVVAMSSNLIIKPLPDIHDEQSTYLVKYELGVSDGIFINAFSYQSFAHLAEKYRSVGQFATFNSNNEQAANINGQNFAVTQIKTSDNFIADFGGQLLLGEEPEQSAADGVWISHQLWQTAFNGSQSVIGQQLRLKGAQLQIRGVLADFDSFKGVQKNKQQVWQFYHLDDYIKKSTGSFADDFQGLYRAKARQLTKADLSAFWDEFLQHGPTDKNGIPADAFKSLSKKSSITPYRDFLLLKQQKLVLFLLITIGVLLLMACLNLLNLFISHYQQRQQELAIQMSLGASKGKLVLMSFCENLPTFLLSGTAGIIGAAWLIRLLPVISRGNISMLNLVHIDVTTVLVALALTVLINFIFAWLSVNQFQLKTLFELLRSGNKGVANGQQTLLTKATFVLQISSAAIVLTAMGMVAKAAFDEVNPDLGFKQGNYLFVRAKLDEGFRVPAKEWREGQQEEMEAEQQAKLDTLANRQIKSDIIQQLSQLDPTFGFLQSNAEPLGLFEFTFHISFDSEKSENVSFGSLNIADDFISSFGISLLAGRNITKQEFEQLDKVMLINETLAKQLSKGEAIDSVIGKTLSDHQIVGVVADHVNAQTIDSNTGIAYYAQPMPSQINLILQLPENNSFDIAAIEQIVKQAHPQITKVKSATLQSKFDENMADEYAQFYVILSLVGLTLILAAFGSGGMALSFAQVKRFEMAIRMATGASRGLLMKQMLLNFSGLMTLTLVCSLLGASVIYWGLQQQIVALPDFSWDALVLFSAFLITIVFTVVSGVVWRVINDQPMQVLREL